MDIRIHDSSCSTIDSTPSISVAAPSMDSDNGFLEFTILPTRKTSQASRPAWLVKFWREAGSVLVALGWGGGGAAGGSAPSAVDPRRLGTYLKALRSQTRVLLKQLPLWERAGIGAVAGGLAGGFTNATLHPLDTVKTKLQTKGSSLVYSGPLDVIRKVSAAQGIGGFYRGLPAAFLGSVLSSSIYFGTYELAKGGLSRDITLPLPFSGFRRGSATSSGSSGESQQDRSGLSPPDSGSGRGGGETSSRSGGGAGVSSVSSSSSSQVVLSCPVALVPPVAAALGNITSSAILVPKEVIKQRMQAGAAGSAWQVLQQTVAGEGVAGLYSGYTAALLRNLPTNVLNFSTFEYLKMAILHVRRATALRPHESMAAGAVAGALSAALTTPLDVVKTRLMTQARVAVAAAGTTGAKFVSCLVAMSAALAMPLGVVKTRLMTQVRLQWQQREQQRHRYVLTLPASLATPLNVVNTCLMTQARVAVAAAAGTTGARVTGTLLFLCSSD
ncbi:unnamed protein product [Closterium sp. Yama58-4]|nr:unnamed protein product [Closterium sp. Yama58-4]